jgi:prevent-host-death family protein
MLTMTSLAAQNQFGTLIDASQRQPVTVTRRGRPVAVVLSYEDYLLRTKTIPIEVAKVISKSFPLRGQEAADAVRAHLDGMSNRAAEEGLREEDVTRMLNDD